MSAAVSMVVSGEAASPLSGESAREDDVLSQIERTHQADLEIIDRLQGLLLQRDAMIGSDTVLEEIAKHSILPVDQSQRNSASLFAKIDAANSLATTISSKVRELDCAQSRLRLALERVDLVLDLKTAIEAVRTALEGGDFEVAAKHTSRMLRQYRSRKDADGSSRAPIDDDDDEDVSFRVLIDLEKQLLDAILQHYEASQTDEETIRYCRLLALVGLAHTGLINHCQVLTHQLAERLQSMEKSPSPLKNVSTVFDLISEFVRVQEKRTQQDFGMGSHLQLVLELQRFADKHVVPIIESFLAQRKLHEIAVALRNAERASTSSATAVEGPPPIDPRDLDRVLDEISCITRECELFDLDLRAAFAAATRTIKENSPDLYASLSQSPMGTELAAVSKLNRSVQVVLGDYVALEENYMITNAAKAIAKADDTMPLQGSLSSEYVDDLFYIVKTSGTRAFGTQSLPSAIAVLNNINSLLVGSYKVVILERVQSTQAALDSSSAAFFTDKTEHDLAVTAELIALNNADTSAQNVILLKDFFESVYKQQFENSHFDALVDQCFVEMVQVARVLRKVVSHGVARHMRSIHSSITPFCDKFEQCPYEISEAQFNSNRDDPYVQQLIQACDQTLMPVKPLVTENLFDSMVLNLASFIAARIAAICANKMFTFSGGLQVDKDVRHLIGYFSQICNKSVRDKFLRLSQIASILQLYDVSEISELRLETSDTDFWRLSPQEVKKMMKRRKEFNSNQIDELQL